MCIVILPCPRTNRAFINYSVYFILHFTVTLQILVIVVSFVWMQLSIIIIVQYASCYSDASVLKMRSK